MKSKSRNYFTNNKGSVLVYVLMGITMMSGVSYMVSDTLSQAGKANIFIKGKLEQKVTHMNAVTLIRTAGVRDAVIKNSFPALWSCLNGSGVNCNTLNSVTMTLNESTVDFGSGPVTYKFTEELKNFSCSSNDCKTVKLVQLTPSCSSEIRCEHVKFKVETISHTNLKTDTRKMINEFTFSYTPLKVGFKQIDYSCGAAGKIISSISFKDMKASCEGLNTAHSCPGNYPLQGINDSSTTTNCVSLTGSAANCANGVKVGDILTATGSTGVTCN